MPRLLSHTFGLAALLFGAMLSVQPSIADEHLLEWPLLPRSFGSADSSSSGPAVAAPPAIGPSTEASHGVAADPMWKVHSCQSGGFSVCLCGAVDESTRTTSNGMRIDRILCRNAPGGLQYLVFCHHLTEQLQETLPTEKDRLDRFRNELVAKYEILGERRIAHKELAGCELALDLSGGNMMLVREFSVDGRVYLCIVGGSAKALQENLEGVHRFFESFALLPSSSAAKSGNADRWREFTPEAGRFRIELPGVPATRSLHSKVGMHYEVVLEDKKSNVLYYLDYGDIPEEVMKNAPSAKELLHAFAAELVGEKELLGKKEIRWQEHPGLELVVRSTETLVTFKRLLLVDRCLYQISVTGPPALVGPGKEPVQRLFSSFAIRPDRAGELLRSPNAPSGGDFRVARVQCFYDTAGTIPAPAAPDVGKVLHVKVQVAGFDRSTGRIDTGIAIQLVDHQGRAMLPRAVQDAICERDVDVVRNVSLLTFAGAVPLSRAGEFILKVTVHDRITNNVAKWDMPLEVAGQ